MERNLRVILATKYFSIKIDYNVCQQWMYQAHSACTFQEPFSCSGLSLLSFLLTGPPLLNLSRAAYSAMWRSEHAEDLHRALTTLFPDTFKALVPVYNHQVRLAHSRRSFQSSALVPI
jgi:hypothetical protein